MKIARLYAVLFFVILGAAVYGQEVTITGSSGELAPIPNSRNSDIISNMTDVMSYVGITWTPLDYQAAKFAEYGKTDRFVLQGTVQLIIRNPDESFTYFVYLSEWNGAVHGNTESPAAVITPKRVKGLDVDMNGLFYCSYGGTRKYAPIPELNSYGKLELPVFNASLYGLKLQ